MTRDVCTCPKKKCRSSLDAGEPHVIRFNMPTEGTTTFHDVIYGDITVNNEEMEDLILIKSDGYPTYNFANVVDDHLMGITHVVRGNEYLSSSPKYNRIVRSIWMGYSGLCTLSADHKRRASEAVQTLRTFFL